MRNRLQVAIVVAIVISAPPGLAGRARADEPAPLAASAAALEPPPALPGTAAGLLEAADAAIDAGNLGLAHALYERVLREHPDAPEAAEARRALKILAASARKMAAGPTTGGVPGVGDETASSTGVVIRREPYSLKTKERLRLTTWEKLDFGTTAFLYGLSVGYSYALSLTNLSDGLPAVAIGALGYTLGAVLFLSLADPDRGDLPLALAISSYLPTTTLLVANVGFDHPSSRQTAFATAFAGVLSIPVAILATHELDLDPGDTQLVRDSGFWGLVLATAGMLGWGGSTDNQFGFEDYHAPTSRAISAAGLVGLYGGLGLGALAAHFNDISLERVRVSTWGGYGGAILGVLLTAANNAQTKDVYRGIGIGSLAGLVITFIATSSLDGIPDDDAPPRPATSLRIEPTLAPMLGVDGRSRAMLGFSGTL